MIIRCRRCDTNFRVPDDFVGTQAPCPECGAPNKIASMDVIDVEYEVQSDASPAPEPVYTQDQPDEETETRDAVPTDEDPPWDTQNSYTVYMQRQMEGNGFSCCSIGCLIFVLFAFLLIRGCMHLIG